MNWEPSAQIKTLQCRAQFIQKIRDFFIARDYLEVETPTLGRNTVTDVYIDSFSCLNPVDDQTYFLQTSPEFFMKRLLAAGSGPIFQISKAFRVEEAGHNHNPEFTMLEWYHPGYDHHDLMHEVDQLTQHLINTDVADKTTYSDLFQVYCNIDPHTASTKDILAAAKEHGIDHLANDPDAHLQLLMNYVIEPNLGHTKPVFVYDYPVSQAALARIRKGSPDVAERFEMYYQTREIANGFHELNCQQKQHERFTQDIDNRTKQNKAQPNIDTKFLSCLDHLPDCSGVALGVDRLFMLAQGFKEIKHCLSFNWQAL